MIRSVLLFAIFFYFQVGIAAVDPPSLRCASVNADGSVTLTWVPPADPLGQFVQYHLFFSTIKNGIYSATVNPTGTTFTHPIDANFQTHYYYMTSEYLEGGITKFSSSSDTLQTIKLIVGNPGNGTAPLIWNALHTPILPTSNGLYYIHKENPAGTWSLIDSTTNLNYTDVVNSCTTINYMVEIRDNSGCSSFSSIDGENFTGSSPPAVTIIDSVSIDTATGFPYICWQPNTSSDVCYYNIYVYDPTQQPVYDSIFSVYPPETCFLLANQSSCNSYRVVAVDCCKTPGNPSEEHNTICLDKSFTGCSDTVELSWNNYKGWAGGVNSYRLYASVNNGPFELVGTTSTGDTTFTHTGVQLNTDYCYYVRAFENASNRTSSSNILCFNTGKQLGPTLAYLQYATVKSETSLELSYYIVPVPGEFIYRLERRKNREAFIKVTDTLSSQLTENTILFTDDSLINTSENNYTYRVSILNVCGQTVLISNLAKTILLKGTNNSDARINSLSWTPYLDWESGVNNYRLFRSVNGIFDLQPAAIVTQSDSSFNDNLNLFYTADGTFCYYIEAYEQPGPVFNMASVSRSNKVCLIQEPNLYVPNAFTPRGLNPVFKPALSYVDYENYKMYIFNRWGQIVFETEDPHAGWDGTIKGNAAEAGLYVYRIKYQSSTEQPFDKTGTVMLLR